MKKVLMIEDEKRIGKAVGLALKEQGYEFFHMMDGQSGLDTARSIRPDLILLDIMLPDMSGFDICRSLKTDEEFQSVPLIMLTALGSNENLLKGLSRGADDYISKPFDLQELLARIRTHLRNKDLYDKVKNEEHEKNSLLDVSRSLASSIHPHETLFTIVSRIADFIEVKRCSIIYLDTVSHKGFVMASHDSRKLKNLEVDLDKYPEIQEVMKSKKPLIINDVQNDPIFEHIRKVMDTVDIKSIMAFPVLFKDVLIGTLVLRTSEREAPFSDRDVRFCSVISHLASAPLKNAFLINVLQKEKELEREMRLTAEDQLQLASTVFESAMEGVLITDAQGTIQSVNPAFCAITGYTVEEALGATPRILKSDKHDSKFYEKMWKSLILNGFWEGEIWNRRKNGEAYPQWLIITARKDSDNKTIQYVAIFHDITLIKRSEDQIRYQKDFDPLTGLPNKALFMDRLGRSIFSAHRNNQVLAVLFLDLDRFKNINEGLGHTGGDELLRMVADRLNDLIRETDTLARWGGDDFRIILEDVKGPEGAANVARKIIRSFEKSFIMDGREISITASMGIALYPLDGENADTLIKKADMALSRGKEQGRNYFQMFNPSLNTITSERLEMENHLRKALEREEFAAYYQPKVDIETGKIVGMEALIRWKHPKRGFVPPVEFIPLAEETGLIAPIGKWMLLEACRQNKKWADAGYSLRVAVNLSAIQFLRQNIIKKVSTILEETGLDPQFLELEITEGTVMNHVESAIAIMRELKNMGVHLAIDDFGTGYSSLSYLKQFPIDTMKVDRSFVKDIPGNTHDAAIAASIVSLAQNLNLEVVAEGVETREQLEFFRERKCDMIQGYLFSAPVPAEGFNELLNSGKRL